VSLEQNGFDFVAELSAIWKFRLSLRSSPLPKIVRFCAAKLTFVAILAIWAIEKSESYLFSMAL
jgi:hypothetical protein